MRMLIPFICFSIFSTVRAEDLIEREAIRRLTTESLQARALALQVDAAQAAARAEGLPPNGSLTYSREDAAGVPETYLLYNQPLSLSGRRRFLRRAAESLADGEATRASLELHLLKVDLRLAFLDVLLAQEEVKILRRERLRLEEIVEVLRKRERAGESSGYDRVRAERELSLLAAEEGGSEARLANARNMLASFLGSPQPAVSLVAVGALSLPGLPDLDSLMARSSKRGDIQAEERAAESATLSAEAARRKVLPEPVISGGWKSPVVNGQRDSGYVLSVTVPLPLFDRGRAERERAEFARQAAEARAAAIEMQVRLRVKAAWEETQARLRTAAAFRDKVVSQTEDLVRTARAAYEGGEMGILELLDAHRSQLEIQIREVGLLAAARRSALDVERWVGEEVIP